MQHMESQTYSTKVTCIGTLYPVVALTQSSQSLTWNLQGTHMFVQHEGTISNVSNAPSTLQVFFNCILLSSTMVR